MGLMVVRFIVDQDFRENSTYHTILSILTIMLLWHAMVYFKYNLHTQISVGN